MDITNFDKEILLSNINKLHTTKLGIERIKKNTGLEVDEIKKIILNNSSLIYRSGKNYYCETKDLIITINVNNYTIITLHKKNRI